MTDLKSFSDPIQGNKQTQTEPQQQETPPACVPLRIVDKDGKQRYCYHGGKCRCDTCELIRKAQQDELDRNLDAFVRHPRLKLVPAVRQAKQKQFALQATYVSPEMGKILLKHHQKLVKDIPMYYLPDMYYQKFAWKLRGPQEVGTQTEIAIGSYGIDGCPCPNKNVCWDLK
ncbi:hypothetical protein KR222_000330 [Zaprionus bogoriensis]|nr:hypothetical protein KR222_000330 [Zaprionus bogoriensis]